MKRIFLIPLLCLGLAACSTETHVLTTTAGSTAATVDSVGTVAAGAAVTGTYVPTGETVNLVTAPNQLTLSLPAIASGTSTATFKNTVAVQFANDEKSYEQTVGNALQTILPLIAQGESATAAVGSLLTQWGLEPVNPTQNTAISNIESDLSKASVSGTLLENYVTGLQTNSVTD